jgi:large subunit ribosomal protein L16
MDGMATRGNVVAFGEYGLQALEPCWMSARQLEAARRVIVRYIRKGGQMWTRVFPDKPVTKRPAESRMGKGKGSVEEWVSVIQPGRVLFEMSGVSEEEAREALRQAGAKLPIATQFTVRIDRVTGMKAGGV